MPFGFRSFFRFLYLARLPALRSTTCWLSGTVLAVAGLRADTVWPDLEPEFESTVRPFVETYCVSCHDADEPKAGLDLSRFTTMESVAEGYEYWEQVLDVLDFGDMPPDDAKRFPEETLRSQVVSWILAAREQEATRHAGDPGIVLARRLSNAEYDYTIRDLTGVDMRPTREFPVDPANVAGFDNSGETLVMSSMLLSKYLVAAREVASHLYLQPDGFSFAPFPMLAETDRDKLCVHQIIDFYAKFNTDYADYFEAAWRWRHRFELKLPETRMEDFATGRKLSAVYLQTIWSVLQETAHPVGPLAKLQQMWARLPEPNSAEFEQVRVRCEAMREFVQTLRAKIEMRFLNIEAPGVAADRYPLLMWKNKQYATHRQDYDRAQLQIDGVARPPSDEVEPGVKSPFGPGKTVLIVNAPGDPDLFVPSNEQEDYEQAFAEFSRVFPDMFFRQERGRNYFNTKKDRGRYLSSGAHSRLGYFRDDQPLYDLVLNETERAQLDALWQEMDFVANATVRTFKQYAGVESRTVILADDRIKSEVWEADARDLIAAVEVDRLEADYLRRAEGGPEVVKQAIREFFAETKTAIAAVGEAREAAETKQREELLTWAEKAYRRPLEAADREELQAFYREARQEGLSHEEAMRETVVMVLAYPDTAYRVDLVETGPGVQPLPPYALASRLSYFLWSSLPDDALLARAAAGDLTRPEVIAAEANRMLRDPRSRALAVEFGGNWLEFRRFEELSTVDREHFTTFTPELQAAMFEEPVRFLEDVFQNDRSILDLIWGEDTFVNATLARHYGISLEDAESASWHHVTNARVYDRGGLLPMAAFLTKNAPGLRTSPVKRGNWVVKTILGERVPPPPPVVSALPSNEAELDLPLRDVLARHRADPSCGSCHERFDSFGLVFEGFGPVGERRENDLGGRPIDAWAEFPDGSEGVGLAGVRDHIREKRKDDFVTNFCRRTLSYALGRSLMISDELLIKEIRDKLAENDYRFHVVIESIVTSPQFLNKRGSPAATVTQIPLP